MSSEKYSSEEYKIVVKTVQTNAFKTLCEALKEILTDTNLIFTPEGIKIIAFSIYFLLFKKIFSRCLNSLNVLYTFSYLFVNFLNSIFGISSSLHHVIFSHSSSL